MDQITRENEPKPAQPAPCVLRHNGSTTAGGQNIFHDLYESLLFPSWVLAHHKHAAPGRGADLQKAVAQFVTGAT